MNLFDITTGQAFPCNDKPRTATMQERNAYLRWLAETRGVFLPETFAYRDSGIWSGTGDDASCILAMPGYGVQPNVICEILDDAGEVVSRMVLPDNGKGKLPMTAKQVQEWSGLKPVKKAKAARKPSQRVEPEPVVVSAAPEIASPAPVADAQPVQSAPVVKTADNSDLVARVAALELALARVGVAVLLSAPIAANDDAPAAPAAKRSPAHARAIQRAWDARCAMRERADLDRRALMIANGDNRLLLESLHAAEAKASDFERIAIAEATRADQAQAQADNARRAATEYKREGIAAEERALNAHARASRIVGAAMRYRTASRRSAQDVRASRAEARALSRRLDDARRSIAASAPPVAPAGNSIAAAFADALS